MSAAKQSSGNALPFRKGALDAAALRAQCPQFRVLVIGKANAGKTTILRKVCNAGPDSKPVIHDPQGNEITQDSPKVRPKLRLMVRPKVHPKNPGLGTN